MAVKITQGNQYDNSTSDNKYSTNSNTNLDVSFGNQYDNSKRNVEVIDEETHRKLSEEVKALENNIKDNANESDLLRPMEYIKKCITTYKVEIPERIYEAGLRKLASKATELGLAALTSLITYAISKYL